MRAVNDFVFQPYPTPDDSPNTLKEKWGFAIDISAPEEVQIPPPAPT
jgi:hypothetical protein